MGSKIEIALSKKKATLSLIGALLFIVAGFFGAVMPEEFVSTIFRSPELVRITGLAAIFFFGLCIIYIAKKLIDNKTGLVIDDNGILDNSSGTSVGIIEWEDITTIETIQIASTKLLILHVRKPEKYIDRAKNIISRQALNFSNRQYHSPISITSNTLKITHPELERIIRSEFEKRKVNS